MVNVSDATKAAYVNDGSHKTITITFPNLKDDSGNTLIFDNSTIVKESLSITESLQNSSTLDFIGCISSTAEFELPITSHTFKDEMVSIKMKAQLSDEEVDEIPLFYGKVDEVTKDGAQALTQKFECYDLMNGFDEKDATEWYSSLSYPITYKQLRDSFWAKFGKVEGASDNQEEIELVNDSISITSKQLTDESTMTALTVIKCICQINGCYGIFNREGKFRYIYLNKIIPGLNPEDTLYPSDTTYPEALTNETKSSIYAYARSLLYKDNFKYDAEDSKAIVGLIIYDDAASTYSSSGEETEDKSAIAKVGETGEDDNKYEIENNWLIYGVGYAQNVAEQIFGAISGSTFRPVDIQVKGLPFLEVGDPIQFSDGKSTITSYILKRTFSGTAQLKDAITSEADDLTSDIQTIDETLTAAIFERRIGTDALYSMIRQTEDDITLEVKRASGEESALTTRIELTETSLNLHAQNIEMLAEDIQIQSDTIEAQANRIDLKADTATLDAKVTTINGQLNAMNAVIRGKLTASKLAAVIADLATVNIKALEVDRVTVNSALDANGGATINGPDISIGASRTSSISGTDISIGASRTSSISGTESLNLTSDGITTVKGGTITISTDGNMTITGGTLTIASGNLYLKGKNVSWTYDETLGKYILTADA